MGESNSIAVGLTALSQILKREKSRGSETLLLKPETEEALNALPMKLMKAATMNSVSAAEVVPEKAAPMARQNAEGSAGTLSSAVPKGGEAENEKWARAQLNEIFKEAKNCEECRGLGTLRDQIVFAVGNPMADIMFIGEAPGSEEEKERKPFVGPAGQKLDQIIGATGLKRDDVYISNIVKFRPKKGDGRFQGTSNRKPDTTEMAASIRYIRREIEVVRPKVIVALGGTAAEGLLEVGGSVSGLRNQVHEFNGVPVVVTYHPSFLLRQEGEGDAKKAMAMKRRVWEDLLKAMEILGMPISEKQRGYFL